MRTGTHAVEKKKENTGNETVGAKENQAVTDTDGPEMI
jgi:hypothetical protein